jgi:hypothetical protein
MATSYANSGGSGNRTPTLSKAWRCRNQNVSLQTVIGAVVDGATSTNAFFFERAGTSSNFVHLEKDHRRGEVVSVRRERPRHLKWQGSNDRATWTDIGGASRSGVTTQTITTLAGIPRHFLSSVPSQRTHERQSVDL